MDDRNWLSKCIFIFCTIVNIQNAASFPHVPNSQEDYLMSVVSAPKGRKHAPSAPLMDERYPSYYTPMAPKQPDRSNHGKPRTHRPIGFTSKTNEGQHEKSRKGTLKLHSIRLSRTKKPRPTWPNLAKKRTTISTEKHEPDPHIEHTTPLTISHIEHTTQLAISHALGGGYPDQTGMYQQQGLGGAYNQMGQSGQPNTGTALLQNILGGNSGNCAPGGYCPQGGGNPFGGIGGGFGNNGLGGGFGSNGFGGGFGGGLGNNGFGGGFGNNGLGGGLGNLFRQGSTTTQSTTTSTTKDPLDLSFNFPSNDNSSDLSSLGSFGDYGLSNATSSSDYGLSLDDSSNSTSSTDGNSTSATNSNSTSETNSNSTSATNSNSTSETNSNSTSTTNSNSTSETNSNSTSTTNSNSTSSVDGSGKVSATNSSNGTSNSSNSSTISTSSSDPKDETTSTTDSLGFDSFNYNYESSDSSSSLENSGLSNAYEDSGLSNAYEDKDLSIDYEDKDLGNDNVNRK